MINQFLAAALGTISFSLIFHVPAKYFPACGVTGGVGWIVYILLNLRGSSVVAIFFATCAVVLLSRAFAIYLKSPVTIFLIAGIFPLVPGTAIYWTAYYFFMNDYSMSSYYGIETLKLAFAIVVSIIMIFEIPQGFFRKILFIKP